MQDKDFYILKVPIKWNDIYQKMLELMANFGIDIIKECNAVCSDRGKSLIQCWMTFSVACSAFELNNLKEAKILIIILIDCLNKKYGTNFDSDKYSDFSDYEGDEEIYEFDINVFKEVDNGVDDGVYEFNENVFETEETLDGTNKLEFNKNIFETK